MPFSSRSYVSRYIPSNRFPVGLRWLLIANVAISVLDFILRASSVDVFLRSFALVPSQVVHSFAIWQLVTYMFLHAGIGHLLWNMLALWLFGIELERTWGTARFLRFYFLCGICAGLTVVAAAYMFGGVNASTVGSSGAVYGVLVAYAVVFPDQTVLFGFLIPMKSKYFVMIIGGIVFLQSYMAVAGAPGTGIAVMAHLGGLVAGYLILRGRRLHVNARQPLETAYRNWKMQRAKRKFEVYLRKQGSQRNRRIH
ncbi:MAG: rhomboid family intramembrane serine protease [Acidobacteriaceae bacterium]|nr:rhomboid family intramembrane serine protease [Acidobacteriaceae bacterium]MBV8573167.1 rhomboid family intramembrane serine protease [Acidobacteriaceae bacterium]